MDLKNLSKKLKMSDEIWPLIKNFRFKKTDDVKVSDALMAEFDSSLGGDVPFGYRGGAKHQKKTFYEVIVETDIVDKSKFDKLFHDILRKCEGSQLGLYGVWPMSLTRGIKMEINPGMNDEAKQHQSDRIEYIKNMNRDIDRDLENLRQKYLDQDVDIGYIRNNCARLLPNNQYYNVNKPSCYTEVMQSAGFTLYVTEETEAYKHLFV